MTTLRVILGDQLSRRIAALKGAGAGDVVLMCELAAEATYTRHHKKKIAFIFSAMRHFAAALGRAGLAVDYIRLLDPGNTHSFAGEIARAVARHRPARVVVTHPGEWRVLAELERLRRDLSIPLEILDDTRFFVSPAAFAAWAKGRKSLTMEYFYRDQRRKTGLLMDGERPAGGQWNFDRDNRKPLVGAPDVPAPFACPPDSVTQEAIDLVAEAFAEHPGRLEGFSFAVTAEQAKAAARQFIDTRLPRFGDYQDAMKAGEPVLFHGVLSPYLNIGLLDPKWLCAEVERAYRSGHAPINAAEGFIRQILGWREFVRGVYWLKMPDYASMNAFGNTRRLPDFYWTGETELNCLRNCISDTLAHAYAHHIQRLMVTGNFALLAGIAPTEICDWYLAVYADAYDWVELPNTLGMVMHADNGILGSKPYAASGKYIDRMSDYCHNCRFDPKESVGKTACPFNSLYWDFLARHRTALGGKGRMAMVLKTLDRMDQGKVAAMRRQAGRFLDTL